jgi:transglutaminase-like putative cysteine protease
VRSAARAVAVSAPALVVLAIAWLRLEQPVGSLGRVLALLAVAVAAALPRRRWLRVAAAVAAIVAGARIAVGVDFVPWRLNDPGSAFGLADAFSSLGRRFGDGFSDFYGTHLPFDPRVHVAMHELVLSGLFLFALGVALLVAARKPVAGAVVLLVGAGWPATLLGPSHGIAMGAAILGAALVLLAGLGARRVPAFALPAAVVVAVAAVAVGSATAARHGLVNWESWNLAHVAGGPTDVNFVWNTQYGGLVWSGKPRTVLQVKSASPPTYLRAAVLDDFRGDRFVIGGARPGDSLEPAVARNPHNQTREDVTATDLSDSHLVGGSIPIRFEAHAPLVTLSPGLAALNQNLPRDFQYTAWSYTARPSPTDLRRSPASYPAELAQEGLLDVGDGLRLPAFGTPSRSSKVLALVATRPHLDEYLPLARLAEQVAGSAGNPYEAVARLEYWFASSHTFRYSNHPPVLSPPLVGFVTTTRAGYCQYFAGAMALMLRYLGIPARVAVGFAGGTYDRHDEIWNISDRGAHAWVEVWFKGYGWLPFDPTPAGPGAPPRPVGTGAAAVAGTPSGSGAAASKNGAVSKHDSSVAANLARKNGFLLPHAKGTAPKPSGEAEPLAGGGGSSGTNRGRPILLLLLVLVAASAAVVLAKAGFRAIRRARRDPRGVAAACRQELAAFLVDQRVEAPRSATLGELGEIVRHEFGAEAGPFVAAATAARFGPDDGAGAAAFTARRELRSLLEQARRSLTRRERARGLLSLRSLGSSGA